MHQPHPLVPQHGLLTLGLILAWYIFLNLSIARRLSEKRLMVLMRAMISDRSNRPGLVRALPIIEHLS